MNFRFKNLFRFIPPSPDGRGIVGFFAFWYILAGLPLVGLNPPFQAPDEFCHFFRAYQISLGGLKGERFHDQVGTDIPASVSDFASTYHHLPFHPERRMNFRLWRESVQRPLTSTHPVFVSLGAAGSYSPLLYLPQVAAIEMGRVAHFGPAGLLYLGRFANWAVFGMLIGLALRRMPGRSLPLALLALTPMTLFIAASQSTDSLNNGLYFLFFALLLESLAAETLRLGLLTVVTLLLGLAKPYPLVAAVWLLPLFRRTDRSRLACWSLLVSGGFLLIAAGWHRYCQDIILPPPHLSTPFHEQVRLALGNPIHTLAVILHTWRVDFFLLAESFVGRLGWFDTPLPRSLTLVWLAVLVRVTLGQNWTPQMPGGWRRQGTVFLLFLFSLLMVSFILYTSWNRMPDAKLIAGIQGRYFIPIFPWLLASVPAGLRPWKGPSLWWTTQLLMAISTVTTFVVLLRRFWI